jgi:hypothetical protein
VRGKHNKLGKWERKVRLGQDSLPNRETTRGNELRLCTLFYPPPYRMGRLSMVDLIFVENKIISVQKAAHLYYLLQEGRLY